MYRGLFLADIHIGALPWEQSYNEYMWIRDMLKKYTEDELLDFIIIGGDYFDKQFYSSDNYVVLAQKLMIQLLASAKVLRVVYGTSSHESDQYSLFDSLIDELPDVLDTPLFDFKVITTVSEEELLPGMKVLYIPEEYIYDKDSYYEEFLSKKDAYDYIFGHGMIYEAFSGRIKKEEKKDTSRKKAPLFSSGELSYACRGDVLFGHYHVHTELPGDVSYVGSLSRWMHGEEEDKGFYQLFFNPDTGEHTKTFVVNTKALTYVTIRYGYDSDVFSDPNTWETTAKKILNIKIKRSVDKLKIVFNIPVGYENSEAFISFFRERFKSYEQIGIDFANGYTENKIKNAKEKVESLPDEYKVFIDKNVPLETKASLFLEMKRGVKYDPEFLKKYLE